eukprot:495973_1
MIPMLAMKSFISLISLVPRGFILGVITERLSSRKVLTSPDLRRIWPTLVKCAVSWLAWKYLLFNQSPSSNDNMGSGFGITCNVPTTGQLLMIQDDGSDSDGSLLSCTIAEGFQFILYVILRVACFYVGAMFGIASQPVGLTGGIACGKSTVSSMLRSQSTKYTMKKDAFAIVDVDAIAHDILIPGKMGSDCGYGRVVKAFDGADIFMKAEEKETKSEEKAKKKDSHTIDDTKDDDGDGRPPIDRRKLGDIIFRDTKKRRALNGITHPLISKIMVKQMIRENLFPSSDNTSTVAVDIPLLFEVGLAMRMIFPIKIVVACDEGVQLERLMERNKDLTKEQCENRIQSQIPISKKVQMGDITIWNNGSMDDLKKDVERAKGSNRSIACFHEHHTCQCHWVGRDNGGSCMWLRYHQAPC